MTIYQTLLARGYLPKELPPAFSSEGFAKYASTKSGRSVLDAYAPNGKHTQCVRYSLALPGLERRELRVPHPHSYTRLAGLVAKNFARLLKKASVSRLSKSRPVYASDRSRAIRPRLHPGNLAGERATSRAGSTFLLKTDISQFYPSLYTHAVGWAIDPQLRHQKNWGSQKLLGGQIDRALMNLDGKLSQGIPIGPDISLLLAEIVLGQVDKALKLPVDRAARWFDDYEIAFDSQQEAEIALKRLAKELAKYRLRVNPKKTRIIKLPIAAQDDWQQTIKDAGRRLLWPSDMVRFFDTAFRLREQYPESAVLLYALDQLFSIATPSHHVGRVAESCITQAMLGEPGCAQKGFSLLTYWSINGYQIDFDIIQRTTEQIVAQHEPRGLSSDVCCALAFCIENGIELGPAAARGLSNLEDDCITIQALHMNALGLLSKGFVINKIAKELKQVDLDREHWLVAYESVRHKFLMTCQPQVQANPLFSDLLRERVSFYRTSLPAYAPVIHAGGAPIWRIKAWLDSVTQGAPRTASAAAEMIAEAISALEQEPDGPDVSLLDILSRDASDIPSTELIIRGSAIFG